MRMRRADIARMLSVLLLAVIAVSACGFVQHTGHICAYPEDCPVCQLMETTRGSFLCILLAFTAIFPLRDLFFVCDGRFLRAVGSASLVSQNIRMND